MFDMCHKGLGGTMIYITDAATLYQYVCTIEGAQKVSVLCTVVSVQIDFLFAHIYLLLILLLSCALASSPLQTYLREMPVKRTTSAPGIEQPEAFARTGSMVRTRYPAL
jgi:hypothetical protein